MGHFAVLAQAHSCATARKLTVTMMPVLYVRIRMYYNMVASHPSITAGRGRLMRLRMYIYINQLL